METITRKDWNTGQDVELHESGNEFFNGSHWLTIYEDDKGMTYSIDQFYAYRISYVAATRPEQ